MLKPVDGVGGSVIAFEAEGMVRGADYEEVMIPAVEAALASGDSVRMLYLLGEDFEGFTADAAWEDTKIGMRHASSFERIAIVTDSKLYGDAVKLFGRAMKAEVETFPTSDLDQAKVWIAA